MSVVKLVGESFRCDRCNESWSNSWAADGGKPVVLPSAHHYATIEYRSRASLYDGRGHTMTFEVCEPCSRAFFKWSDAKREQIEAEREAQ